MLKVFVLAHCFSLLLATHLEGFCFCSLLFFIITYLLMSTYLSSEVLALMSNLMELACLQHVIGEQLAHRQPTERKVL